jgi:hypothetical protein
MVGVRSSRGCKPCRRKKRGCDLSQPICGQCLKIGAKCAYEDRSWTFMAPQQYAATTQPCPTPASLSPRSLLRTDQRQQLETVYLEAYLPSGETPSDTAFTNSVVGTWINTIVHIASTNHVARIAFDSCILMTIGQMQGNLDFTHHGMAMYCQALTKTNQALQHAATAQTDATLAACQILAMCERYRLHAGSEVSTQATDYQRHVQGTAKLLELRGSHRHVDEHGFTLFANARSIIAHSNITRRQKAVLDSSQWFEVPWSVQNRQRTLKDKLVDAMLMVAASLEQLDRCCHDTGSKSQPSEEFLKGCASTCITSVQRLRAWEIEVLRTSSHTRLEDICAHQGFGIFHLIMSYWAVFLLLSARCWPVLNRVREPTPVLQALASLLPQPQVCAVNIATHAHRYFPLTAGLVGPQKATFPLGAALHYIAAMRKRETAGWSEFEADTTRDCVGDMTAAMRSIKDLFRTNERARSTAEFLRSMAPVPAPQNVKGDTRNTEEHVKMAREWFKV